MSKILKMIKTKTWIPASIKAYYFLVSEFLSSHECRNVIPLFPLDRVFFNLNYFSICHLPTINFQVISKKVYHRLGTDKKQPRGEATPAYKLIKWSAPEEVRTFYTIAHIRPNLINQRKLNDHLWVLAEVQELFFRSL